MKIQEQITNKVAAQFAPTYFDIANESHMHSGPALESHFKIIIVSDAFTGKRKVARHQAVYGVLSEELAGEVHALAMHLYSPEEWAAQPEVAASPNCMGGSKS